MQPTAWSERKLSAKLINNTFVLVLGLLDLEAPKVLNLT
jgi:hypothetical protein